MHFIEYFSIITIITHIIIKLAARIKRVKQTEIVNSFFKKHSFYTIYKGSSLISS